jgi:hypothetical protein
MHALAKKKIAKLKTVGGRQREIDIEVFKTGIMIYRIC